MSPFIDKDLVKSEIYHSNIFSYKKRNIINQRKWVARLAVLNAFELFLDFQTVHEDLYRPVTILYQTVAYCSLVKKRLCNFTSDVAKEIT